VCWPLLGSRFSPFLYLSVSVRVSGFSGLGFRGLGVFVAFADRPLALKFEVELVSPQK